MNKKKLFKAIKKIIKKINNKSDNYYNKIKPILAEESHSFGLKPLNNFCGSLIDELDREYNTEAFSYYFYETQSNKQEILDLIDERALNLLINKTQNLFNEGIIYENLIKEFLIQGDSAGFKPIDETIVLIQEQLDKTFKTDRFAQHFYEEDFEPEFRQKIFYDL
jgi:hypothetical protein